MGLQRKPQYLPSTTFSKILNKGVNMNQKT